MTLLIAYFVLLCLILLALPLWSHFYGKTPLVSLRNLTLFSFFWYQAWNAIHPLTSDVKSDFIVRDLVGSGWIFAMGCTLFLFVYVACYRLFGISESLSHKVPVPSREPSILVLLFLMPVLVVIGGVAKLTVTVPVIGILVAQLGVGLIASVAVLAGWVFARSWQNVVSSVIVIGTLGACSVLSIWNTFGRRELLGVLVSFAFGIYFSRFRGAPIFKFLVIAAVASYPLLVLINAYSITRGEVRGDTGPEQAKRIVEYIATGGTEPFIGMKGIGRSQEAEGAFWIIENYPRAIDYPPLFGVWYSVVNTVPRAFWQGKPVPVSSVMAKAADIEGVNQDAVTITVGVVGEAFADRWQWFAIMAYAAFAAFIIRFFDSLLWRKETSALLVAAVAINLGQIVGLFRGSFPNFVNLYLVGFIMVYPTLLVSSRFIGRQINQSRGHDGENDKRLFEPGDSNDLTQDSLEGDELLESDFGEMGHSSRRQDARQEASDFGTGL